MTVKQFFHLVTTQRELWEISGDHWILPTEVRWSGEDIATVNVPQGLLGVMHDVLAKKLKANAASSVDTDYFFTREVLEKIGHRSTLTAPELIVDWRREPIRTRHFTDKNELADELVDDFMRLGLLKSRAVAATIYAQFCTVMLDRLVNRVKPVDLFFATIYPLQTRANWKEIVLGKEVVNKFVATPRNAEERCRDFMVSHDMLGIDRKTERVRWHLEIVPSSTFTQLSDAIEQKRGDRVRWGSYWRNVTHRLYEQLPYAIAVYRYYCKKISEKSMALPTCKRDSRQWFRHWKTKDQNRPASSRRAYVLPHVLPGDEPEAGSGGPAPVVPPHDGLPPLSGV